MYNIYYILPKYLSRGLLCMCHNVVCHMHNKPHGKYFGRIKHFLKIRVTQNVMHFRNKNKNKQKQKIEWVWVDQYDRFNFALWVRVSRKWDRRRQILKIIINRYKVSGELISCQKRVWLKLRRNIKEPNVGEDRKISGEGKYLPPLPTQDLIFLSLWVSIFSVLIWE